MSSKYSLSDELKQMLLAWLKKLWVMVLNFLAWLKDQFGKR